MVPSQDYSRQINQPSYYQFTRHPLPYLQRKKVQPQSYVSERLNRIRKERAKIPLQTPQEYFNPQIRNKKVQKQLVTQSKKHLIMSPNKVVSSQTIVSSFQPFRKQLELMRKKPIIQVNYEQLLSNLHPFTNAMRDISSYKNDHNRKKQQRQLLRKKKQKQAYRNQYKSLQSHRNLGYEQLNNNANLLNDESYFLNIGKMNLLQNGQKVLYNNQKNQACVSSFGQRKGKGILINGLEDEYYENQQILSLKNGKFKLPRLSSNIKNKQKFSQSKVDAYSDSPQLISSKTIDTSDLKLKNQDKIVSEISNNTDSPTKSLKQKKRPNFSKKLNIPFEKYYYRSMLWKINYSNRLLVQVPQNYEHRLKAYIGKGNNSALIRGLVKRRIWFALTDRIEQANFVWTQLKSLPYFKLQQTYIENTESIEISPQSITLDKKYKRNGLFSLNQQKQFQKYILMYKSSEERSDERLLARNKYFKYQKIIKSTQIKQQRIQNHLINNYVIGNKKALFQTMSQYYSSINKQVFDYLPLTFHIKTGLQDPIYFKFLKYYYNKAKNIKNQANQKEGTKSKKKISKNIWIVKPGQNSNRGNGIKVCFNLQQIKAILKKKQLYPDGTYRTYILQQYIQNPLLYNKRKFDLRHYMMITCVNGIIKGYWYQDGYARTTSFQYNLKNNGGSVHLTNDAVQKNLPDYGKYQKGNKLSYGQLEQYIKKKTYHSKVSFKQHILPKMKQITTDIIKAASSIITPNRQQNNFQLYGLDFMLDSDLKLYLIEVNSNPCLEISCPLLGGIIPRMIENLLEITMDTVYPPPSKCYMKGVHYQKNLEEWNRFQLVYDQNIQGKIFFEGSNNVLDGKLLQEQDDTFEDDGQQWDDTD